MACHQARSEYIDAVQNVIDLTALMVAERKAHIALLRERTSPDIRRDIERWQTYLTTLPRLLDEQERSLAIFQRDRKRHLHEAVT